MSKILNDHQESDLFTYNRTWDEIEGMLSDAEKQKNVWWVRYLTAQERGTKKEIVIAARNYKALEGVVKTLRWVLGDIKIRNPLN